MAQKRFRAVALIGAAAVTAYALVVRPWHLHWGLRKAEAQRALPGDDLVPHPQYASTRAILMDAPAARVWSWLVQIGVGRGGFYTYDALENLAGLGIHSADRLYPEWQTLRVGESIHISPVTPLRVAVLEPQRALVLHTIMHPFTGETIDRQQPVLRTLFEWTWAFVLEEITPGTTRLVVRVRGTYKPAALRVAVLVLLEPLHFVMERGMLQGLKRRAERPSL